MARNGMVEFEEILQDGKPDRKVYSITEKGRQELMKGLAHPKPTHKVRSEFLAILWFAHLLSDEQIDALVDQKVAEIDEFLKLIAGFAGSDCESASSGARFVAGFGQYMATAFRTYLEENRQVLVESAGSPKSKVAVG